MNRVLRICLVMAGVLLVSAAAAGQNDREGTKDYPGIKRMPGYYIDKYDEKQFDAVAMRVTKNGKTEEVQTEGRVVRINYYQKENQPATSTLQVVRNYQNAAKSAGGTVLFENSGDSGSWRETTMKFMNAGKEVWFFLESRNDNHQLTVVEKQAMAQEVTINAKSMASDLSTAGRVAIYGIYFDTGKSELKPESDAAVTEIAKLLKQQPALKVYIVGHTDMAGDAGMNVKLSQARAQSVVTELVAKHAIPATRLVAFGAGPYAPVASNKEEDGRAKNRRVELVEIATK